MVLMSLHSDRNSMTVQLCTHAYSTYIQRERERGEGGGGRERGGRERQMSHGEWNSRLMFDLYMHPQYMCNRTNRIGTIKPKDLSFGTLSTTILKIKNLLALFFKISIFPNELTNTFVFSELV